MLLELLEKLKLSLKKVASELLSELPEDFELELEASSDKKRGHLASALALRLAKELGESPFKVAEKIKEKIELPEGLEHVELVAPGFLNFYFSKSVLQNFFAQEAVFSQIKSGEAHLVEHSSPNLFKPFHIGHMVNNFYGSALASMLKSAGAKVTSLSFPSDVSPGIAKAVWGIMVLEMQNFSIEDIGRAYAFGVEKYESDPKAKAEIDKINEKIYKKEDSKELKIYEKGKELSLKFFEESLALLDSKIDEYIFESEAEKVGKELVLQNTPSVFEKSDGAYIFKGTEKCNLFDNVFVNSQGFGTYLAKDLGLLKLKFERYSFDSSITITDIEQKDHFALLVCAASFIDKSWKGKSRFLQHGRMAPRSGKFSSRYGNVPLASEVLGEVEEEVKMRIKAGGRGDIKDARKIALSALKYSVLKVSMGKPIVWDKEKALSFEGDSGPYILYSLARANSLLEKAKLSEKVSVQDDSLLESELARELLRFDFVFKEAVESLSPHKLIKYMDDLSKSFSRFYASEQILTGDKSEKEKLTLTLKFKETIEMALQALNMPIVYRM